VGKALRQALIIGGPRRRTNGISVANVHTNINGINDSGIGDLKYPCGEKKTWL
jgi:hypothetical protein